MNVLAVIVLYKQELNESKTYNSFIKYFNDFKLPIKLLIYDNSPIKRKMPKHVPLEFEFVHDFENGGLSRAYNYALKLSIKYKYEWILLLDQDTTLSEKYFNQLYENLVKLNNNDDIVSIVPKIISKSKLVSPRVVNFIGTLTPTKICDEKSVNEIMAINSGSVVRRSFMELLGGFNVNFKLDFLDHWLFNQIYKYKKKVFIMNATLTHELSVSNYNNISEERYRSILNSETHFYKSYKPKIQYYIYLFRLFLRSCKRLLTSKNKNISYMTLRHFKNIVFNFKSSVKETL